MALLKIILSYLTLMAIVEVNSKSMSCADNLTIPQENLYPNTPLLALHPMDDTPLTGGAPQVTDPVCPTGDRRATSDSSLEKRQTCPVDYVTNFDADRIPAVIQEARCLCTGCLNLYSGVEDSSILCEEVKYRMTVLRKQRDAFSQGLDKYSLTEEEITVGCVCPQFLF